MQERQDTQTTQIAQAQAQATLANGTERPTDWSSVNWRKANRQVRNLRQRIFRASQAGDLRKARSLQKLMLRSYSNTLVSVRRITQINKGKNTAGVDKLVVKTPGARGRLADQIETYQPWQAKPAKRVYIPKKGIAKGKLRPLGIPTVLDRVLQAKVKNALEPFWEARFEGTSYGFRPGRSCHDAIVKIYMLTNADRRKRKRWVVDADIKGAFDNINHEFLLQTIGSAPGRELIRQWLKAGYMEGGVFHETEAGTPQDGVISPLLANIALHGMDEAVGVRHNCNGLICGPRAVVRYADDFVVLCESREDAEKARDELKGWLDRRGLQLSQEKTRIVHLTEGFDFLGFTIRLHTHRTSKTGYKLHVRPSKQSVREAHTKLRDKWLRLRGSNVIAVLNALNPIIRGWANYFRVGTSSKTFKSLDSWMFHRAVRYVNHTHPNKPNQWRRERYWGRLNLARNDPWVFGDKPTGGYLLKFRWFTINRHILVRGTSSPDDPHLREYWLEREKAKASSLPPRLERITRRQKCVCRLCGESLFNGEQIQQHHLRPKSKGGNDYSSNLTLVHLYCQQQIHSGQVTPVDADGQPLLLA